MKRTKLYVLLAFCALLGAAVIIGCTNIGDGSLFPGGGGGGTEARFAVVVNGASDDTGTATLNVYSVNGSTGALTSLVSGFDPGIGQNCCDGQGRAFIDIDPDSRFVYVPLPSSGQIAVFSLNQSSGALTPVAGSPFTASGTNPYTAKLNQAGTILWVTNYQENNVATYTVSAAGALAHVGTDQAVNSDPHLIIIDPNERFMYIPDENGFVNAFTIGANGALTPVAGSPFDTGQDYSAGGTVDSTGSFLLVGNKYSCSPGTISVFAINQASGALTEVAGSPFTSELNDCGPYTVAEFHVGGQTFMAANNFEDTPDVAVFSFNSSTGALTPVAGSPFNLNGWQFPHYVAVDPSGRFGYVLDYGCPGFCFGNPSTITVVTVGSNGNLTQVAGSPFNNGVAAPGQIVFGR